MTEPQEPVRVVPPDELPVWAPGEGRQRAMFELVRDNWFAIKAFAEARALRSLAILDRAAAEKAGGWPPPALLRHRGAEYGLGEGPATARDPRIQADWDADPRNVLVAVVMEGGDAVGELVFSLDHGPAGADLAGGNRPREVAGDELLAALGQRRAALVQGGLGVLAQQYREARARGVARPVLVTLDLSDRGARAVARELRPGHDPKKAQARTRRDGDQAAVLHAAGAADVIARALGNYGQTAAAQILRPPPEGAVWYVIVSGGRTQLLGQPLSQLPH
jgi:hypothetical protein